MEEALTFFSESDLPTIAVTASQQIVYWNRAAASVFGLLPNDAGNSCWTVMNGQTDSGDTWCQQGCPAIKGTSTGKPACTTTLRVLKRNGAWLRLTVTTLPYPATLPNPYGIHLLHLCHTEPTPARADREALHIGLMGPLQVRRPDGKIVGGPLWRRTKVRGLLAILALHRGQPVARDYIIELLWPDLERPKGLANLNTTVYYLRRCLEPTLHNAANSQYVQLEDGNYFLASNDQIVFDFDQFKQGITRASLLQDDDQAIAALTSTLALYRGPFLQDLWQLCDWSTMNGHPYEDIYRDGMLMLAHHYARSGDNLHARRTYADILASDPCNEVAARRMIAILGQEGRHSEAWQACRQLRTALRSELNIEPTEETVCICDTATRRVFRASGTARATGKGPTSLLPTTSV